MTQPAILVENLSKQYQIGLCENGNKTFREAIIDLATSPLKRFQRLAGNVDESETFWALKDVSFEVQPGEVVGIIGRNGAGKSTLLKVLSRITEPTEGRVKIRGRVGSLLEVGTGFHGELTGRENIYLNGSILGMSRKEMDRKFDEIVDFSGVEKFLDTPVKRYSSGMKIRLGFAVAAHLEPDILIVDEVLAVGDFEFQKKCLGKMNDVAKSGRTVLFVSHNMAAVQRLCGRVVVLDEGRIVSTDNPENATRSYFELTRPSETDSSSLAVQGGDFELCGVRVEGADGALLRTNAIAHFHIPVRFCRPCTDSHVHIFVQSSEGETIFGFGSQDVSGEVHRERGAEFTYDFRVESLPLLPGPHCLCVKVRSYQLRINERIDLGQCFDVAETPVYGSVCVSRQWHGLVAVNATLNVTDSVPCGSANAMQRQSLHVPL